MLYRTAAMLVSLVVGSAAAEEQVYSAVETGPSSRLARDRSIVPIIGAYHPMALLCPVERNRRGPCDLFPLASNLILVRTVDVNGNVRRFSP